MKRTTATTIFVTLCGLMGCGGTETESTETTYEAQSMDKCVRERLAYKIRTGKNMKNQNCEKERTGPTYRVKLDAVDYPFFMTYCESNGMALSGCAYRLTITDSYGSQSVDVTPTIWGTLPSETPTMTYQLITDQDSKDVIVSVDMVTFGTQQDSLHEICGTVASGAFSDLPFTETAYTEISTLPTSAKLGCKVAYSWKASFKMIAP